MTVWEWLVLLVVAGGFASVLVAGARRAPIVDLARTLKNELEEIDRVVHQQEKDGVLPPDGVWDPEEIRPLVKEKFSRLRETGLDPFGAAYPPVPAGQRPEVAAGTIEKLRGTVDAAFWSPFRPAGQAQSRTSNPLQPAMIDDDLPHVVMGACMEVHRALGPGWEDFAYRAALANELKQREIFFKTDAPIPITYKGERIESAAKVDFIIENKIVLLVFALDSLAPSHKEKLTSYLRHGGYPSGFIINFNVTDLRDGVKRVVVRHSVGPGRLEED